MLERNQQQKQKRHKAKNFGHAHCLTHTHRRAEKCYYNLLLISFAAQGVGASETARWPPCQRVCVCQRKRAKERENVG